MLILFQTDRLVVREVLESDFYNLHRIYTDEDNMRYISTGKYDWTLQELKEKYNKFNQSYEKGIGLFVVLEKETDTLIGEAGIFDSFGNLLIPELGYILDHRVWGKGYGSELCKGMIDYCFNRLEATEIVARMYADNLGSVRVSEKNGMQRIEFGVKDGIAFYEYRIKK